ncbi:MAG: hypothetical protein R8N50_04085 [Alphaproteobacteria bacterium]|nr:hypothetical protein [Alphaproteobacteria bacterium]
MKNFAKKLYMFASVLGAAVLLSGCMMECPNKKARHHQQHSHHKQAQRVQPVAVVEETDSIVVYQTYEDADVNHVYAKMYTHSSRGGESKMGHIKFKDTDSGLKMMVDLKDLRPGVQYNVRLYQCSSCYNDAKCCDKSKLINVQMPMLQADESRHLSQTYIIQGLSAAQLCGANIYLERDGGYKAGWGKLEK